MRQSRGNRRPRQQGPRRLFSRATAVVLNPDGEVLLVKHNRENEWALPGGQIMAGEDPATRAVLEVAEEVGLHIVDPQFVGRYVGTVASHQAYLAQNVSGTPRPNPREIQDAVWWDGQRPLRTQAHVDAILALARDAAAKTRVGETSARVRSKGRYRVLNGTCGVIHVIEWVT